MADKREIEERWDDRTRALIGDEGVSRLAQSRVLVAGVGGVGGYAAEMLARAGVGFLKLIDADDVAVTNLNRQLIALEDNIGKPKVDLFAERFGEINPDVRVEACREFITPDNVAGLIDSGTDGKPFDFVIDAIDTVAPKVSLIAHCLRGKIAIASSMGAGGRINPSLIGLMDLWETREDGLARAVRQRLKKIGLRAPLKVVASTEAPKRSAIIELDLPNKQSSFGTLATIPALFGIYLASACLNQLLKN